MNKQAEKLVEEIAGLICPICDAYEAFGGECSLYSQPEDCDDIIVATGLIIDRIGKAYAIGEAYLPNEAARIWSATDSRLFSWMEGWIAQGVRSYIALRPLSGTSKEEEK